MAHIGWAVPLMETPPQPVNSLNSTRGKFLLQSTALRMHTLSRQFWPTLGDRLNLSKVLPPIENRFSRRGEIVQS